MVEWTELGRKNLYAVVTNEQPTQLPEPQLGIVKTRVTVPAEKDYTPVVAFAVGAGVGLAIAYSKRGE